MYHPNADSYKDLSPKQIYRQQENEKKHMYVNRAMEVEQATRRNGGRVQDTIADSQNSLLTRKGRVRHNHIVDPDKGFLRNLEISPSIPWRITGNKENLHEFTGHGLCSKKRIGRDLLMFLFLLFLCFFYIYCIYIILKGCNLETSDHIFFNVILELTGKSTPQPYRGSGQRFPSQS